MGRLLCEWVLMVSIMLPPEPSFAWEKEPHPPRGLDTSPWMERIPTRESDPRFSQQRRRFFQRRLIYPS